MRDEVDSRSLGSLIIVVLFLAAKEGPLSLCRLQRSPNLGMTNKILETSKALSVIIRKASTYPVNVST